MRSGKNEMKGLKTVKCKVILCLAAHSSKKEYHESV